MEPERNLVHTILNDWNNTDIPYSTNKCLHQLFEERVLLQPDHIALVCGDETLTYNELNKKANQIARELTTLGIQEDTFVGILLPRSLEMIVSLFAILKNGSAYVPLNLTDPLERILLMSKTANIEYIITTNEFKEGLTEEGKNVIVINELIDKISNLDNTNVKNKNNPEAPAYIIFTSGTTGTPKGVLVKHQPVINLIEWVNNTFSVGKDDKLIWTTNLSFDLSVYDIFGILAAGATIRILDDKERMDPEKQLYILFKEKITFWDSAPQSFQRLIPFFPPFQKIKNGNSLRLVFFSGDWIPLKLPEEIKSLFPQTTIIGLGGATEATIWSNYFVIDHIDREWKSIPYGKPIQNAKYYILDENLQHCDILTPGDLYIGGECLASGYYNDEKLTSFKFIPDPYNKGFKMYLTGDKAQWMNDGNIELLGREDQQVKIRGYRVELGEIKQAVLNFKDIQDCVVVPDKTDRHNVKIFCFCKTQSTGSFDKTEMMSYLSGKLPDYMLPTDLITVQKFPITTNGKIDSKSLLNTYLEDQQKEFLSKQPNLVGLQKTLFDIWSELLGHSNFSINDDFKDVGGNSLFVYRFIARLKEKTNITLSFMDLNNHPYISALSDLIGEKTNVRKKAINIIHDTKLTKLPLSSQQKRIWLSSLINLGAPVYNENFTYVLSGHLDENKFREALGLLFNRHIILSSTFKYDDNEPWCDLNKSQPNISILDFSDNSEDNRDNIFQFLDQQTKLLFDFNKGPLYRFNLLKLNINEYIFQFVVHHIIFDGLSFQILIRDLSEIYNYLAFQQDLSLPEIRVTQYDFAEWESKAFDPVQTGESLNYWKKQLTGMPGILNFPYDYSRSETSSGYGDRVPLNIPADLSRRLRELSHRYNCTMYVTLLSLFGILIKKYTNDKDFCIGLPVSCKHDSLLENVIGMFVNTIPMRFTFEDEETIADLAKNIKEKLAESIDHQNVPFERIVEAINPERIKDINPFFQVSFAWQEGMVTFEMKGIKSTRHLLKGGVSPFEITCYIWDNGEVIEGEFEYNIDLLKQETIIRLRDNFITLLENLTKNSDASIDVISILSDNEKNLFQNFNNTLSDFPKDKTIIQLFEEQVLHNPFKTALVFEEESLTYRQLNSKANQLAHTLRQIGVSRNAPVGLLAEKSLDMIVGIIGILKAGGVYVPIDPDYPKQRIDFIIDDSGCKVLLTQNKYIGTSLNKIMTLSLNDPGSYVGETSNPEKINTSSDLAYIMYTSGTTGMPKGSMIGHKSVVRLVRNTNYIELTSEARILLTGAIVFDATTFEIWGALLNGGSLYIAEKETILNPKSLGEELVKNDITILWLTSALFTHIAESRTDIFGKLKYLLVGGDVLSASHINKVRKANPGLKVINGYGPTENTTFSTTYLIEKDFDHNIPIGRPISNSTAYIFDKNMNYQPIGVIGELYVGGDGVSMGYINRDDLNKKSFIDNPHIPGERLYRTGDYARWLPDGNIEFHGRVDNQLKIRGFRVELEEIESVILEIDDVIETVIKPIKIQEGDIRLVAFLNVSDTFSIDTKELSRRIKEKLPSYMVPSAYKFMQGFPRTINGKIDRKALNFDFKELKSREREEIKALTTTEKIIHKIWSEILKTEDISVIDNFFDVGGNSLMAISIMSKMESAFKVELELRVFFDSPKIKDLAEVIDIKIYNMVEREYVKERKEGKTGLIKGEI